MFDFYEILAEVFTPNLKAVIARKFGINQEYVTAWGRAPESDDTPSGTGKASYLDHSRWLIRKIYKTNPAAARRIIEIFNDDLERLEKDDAEAEAEFDKSPNRPLAALIKHSAAVIETLVAQPTDPLAWLSARVEISRAKADLSRLDSNLVWQLKNNGNGEPGDEKISH